jgi:two-component system LytT family sensor kinase
MLGRHERAAMTRTPSPLSDRTLLAATVVLWVTTYVAWTADWAIEPMAFTLERALRRVPVCMAGAALCWGLSWPLRMAAGRPLMLRLGLAVALCVGASLLQSVISQVAFYVIAPRWGPASLGEWLSGGMTNFWVFGAWAALYFALDYDAQAREGRLRLADAQAGLLQAQNRALAQQVDPHFLFNALNTVSGLIVTGETGAADRTVLALARLLRAMLDRELPAARPLGEEIAAQGPYLQVQTARFPERFQLVDAVPPQLRGWPVPSLILQPLIENVFTHGVARSPGRVTLEVFARQDGDVLIVGVRDDAAPAGEGRHRGQGIGLDNVRARLATLYGEAATLTSGPREPHGWEVTMRLPKVRP